MPLIQISPKQESIPVSVYDRLPEKVDAEPYGWCWWFKPRYDPDIERATVIGNWIQDFPMDDLEVVKAIGYSHWLPANKVPLPGGLE